MTTDDKPDATYYFQKAAEDLELGMPGPMYYLSKGLLKLAEGGIVDTENGKERRALYAETRKDLLVRTLSNSEKYDAAILTLSMAALGLSLTLIRAGMGQKPAHGLCLLLSWWFFGLAIVVTICSFFSSNSAINKQLDYAKEYYLENKEESLSKTNVSDMLTNALNYISGILFILGVGLTLVFVSTNLLGA